MTTHCDTVPLTDGRIVTRSYGVPVAVYVPGRGHLKTDRKYSSTSSRHANLYARQRGEEAVEIPHIVFKDLVSPLPCAD